MLLAHTTDHLPMTKVARTSRHPHQEPEEDVQQMGTNAASDDGGSTPPQETFGHDRGDFCQPQGLQSSDTCCPRSVR